MPKVKKEKKDFKKRTYKGRNPKKESPRNNPDANECPGNDFAWYNKNPQLLNSAGALIFSKRYGDIYSSFSYNGSGYNVQTTGNRAMAGVIRAKYYPFISALGGDADAINIAGKNLYTWLRHKNSGAKVYEASDLVQVLLATGSVKAAIEFAKKLLRCVASYSAINRYSMRYIVPYSNSEFSNMVANLANYTARLNIIISKATSLVIPKDIPLFSRWKWLSANVFRDDDQKKCSYYTFQPEIIWHYDWANHKCTEQSLIVGTFQQLLSTIEGEIDNLLQYEDYGTISGDILKAYGEANLDVTTGIGLGEIQDPAFDPEAVKQFKNMIIINGHDTYSLDQVSGNTQLIYTNNSSSAHQSALPGKFMSSVEEYSDLDDAEFRYKPKLVVSSDQPSVEEVVEQTRLSYELYTYKFSASDIALVCEEVGTEVITGCKAFYFSDANFNTIAATRNLETLSLIDVNSSDMTDFVRDRAIMTGVSGDPQYCAMLMIGTDITVVQYFHGDNITVLDTNYLTTLHKACVLSEWTMPMFSFLEVK